MKPHMDASDVVVRDDADRQARRWGRGAFGVLVLLVVVAGLLLVPLPVTFRRPWLAPLLDALHVPALAAVTVGLWFLSGRRLGLAVWLAAAWAVVFELLQLGVGRSWDPRDVVLGWIGITGAAMAVRLFARPAKPCPRGRRLVLAGGSGMLLVAVPLATGGPALLEIAHAWRAFPVLSDFRSGTEKHRWQIGSGTLVRLPDRETGGMAARLAPLEGHTAYGAVLFPVRGDWRSWRRICFEFSVESVRQEVLLSVRDGRRLDPESQRRFDDQRWYPPGRHRVCYSLDSLAGGNGHAPIDISRIQSVHLYVTYTPRPASVLVHQITLE